MPNALRGALKQPDVRKRILVTLAAISLYQVGAHIPAPFTSPTNIEQCSMGDTGALSLMNLFSGGAFGALSVFALGVMPYITASIVMQLMGVVFPALEELRTAGGIRGAKHKRYTWALAAILGFMQAFGVAGTANTVTFAHCPHDVIPDASLWKIALIALVMTVGVGLIIALAEYVTKYGLGQGMSILVFAGVVASLPTLVASIQGLASVGAQIAVLVTIGLMAVVVVWVEGIQRRIPLTYARKNVRHTQRTYLPMKLNMANVVPVIFATSILSLPGAIALAFGKDGGRWANTSHPVYLALLGALIVFFAFFYVSITFKPKEIADNINQNAGTIPGLRPGIPTEKFLEGISKRLTLVGSLYLVGVVLIPIIVFRQVGLVNATIGGTSLIIMVGVAISTLKSLESHLTRHHYDSFLKGVR